MAHATPSQTAAGPPGTAYVASHVPMPGCTGEMYQWWFWWHALESARYTLWYPHNHVRVRPHDPEQLTRPGLSHVDRCVGARHDVDEYIGPELVEITIRFVDPRELGLDATRFAEAAIVGHACARVSLRRSGLESVTMIHLARRTVEGIEQRSRYWIGHDVKLQILGASLSVDTLGAKLGVKRRLAGERVAYEQLLHDQIEFTHLTSFLARIHAAFGS